MARYAKTFKVNDFILQSDGRYMATIYATTHGFDINYHVCKMLVRDEDMNWRNQLAVF